MVEQVWHRPEVLSQVAHWALHAVQLELLLVLAYVPAAQPAIRQAVLAQHERWHQHKGFDITSHCCQDRREVRHEFVST